MVSTRGVRRWLAAAAALVTTAALAAVIPAAVPSASAAPLPLPPTEAATRAVSSPVPGRRDLLWTSGGTLKDEYMLRGGSWGRPLDLGGSLRSQPAVVSWGA